MTRISWLSMPGFVSPVSTSVWYVNPNFICFTDHSIQSAGAAGVWRMDAIGLP